MKRMTWINLGLAVVIVASSRMGPTAFAQQADFQLPTEPLKFGAFVVRFDSGGTFALQGQG